MLTGRHTHTLDVSCHEVAVVVRRTPSQPPLLAPKTGVERRGVYTRCEGCCVRPSPVAIRTSCLTEGVFRSQPGKLMLRVFRGWCVRAARLTADALFVGAVQSWGAAMASKGQMQLKSRSSSSSSADMEERVASLEPMTGISRAQKVKAIFSQFDKNDDGRLSKDEMAALVVAVNPSVRFSEEQVPPTVALASFARLFAPSRWGA